MKDGASCSAGCGCGPQGGVSAQVPAGEPAAGAARFRSTFRVPGMDCPSEEVQIRAALGGLAQGLRFDLLRLREKGIGAVGSDLTHATQQARALSRDVDHAIEAATELRESLS